MNIGTKSLLFGVHQFLWHPITVARAWRSLYRRWPRGFEWLAVLLHDCGYWGQPNIDGAEGQQHPVVGARLVEGLVLRLGGSANKAEIFSELALFHSRHYAKLAGEEVSALFAPDKLCVMFDPPWFYILRARLSGEIKEYRENAAKVGKVFSSDREWLTWYRAKVEQLLVEHKFHENHKRLSL